MEIETTAVAREAMVERPMTVEERRRREGRRALLLITPSIIIPALLMLMFLFGIYMTFTNWRLTTGYAGFVGLENYIRLVQTPAFHNAVFRTLEFTIIDVPLELGLGLGLALLLNQPLKGLRLWRALLILPLMTPPVVGSMLWKVLLRPTGAGIFNFFLGFLGVPAQGFLGDPAQALPALVLIDVWLFTPFVATILLAGLQSLPRDPYEAALVDGASTWQSFRYITLPLLVPFFIVVAFFRGIDSLNVFDTIYGTTMGGPGDSSRVMNIMALEEGFLWYNLSTGITVTVFLWIVCMTVGFFLYRQVRAQEENYV